MDWIELIRASRLLASGQPSQEALRRAVSTAYYAMFHALATSNADLIAGIKRQRENADYNPNVTFVQNQVITWIDRAQQAIIDFNAASPQERAMVAVATLAGQR